MIKLKIDIFSKIRRQVIGVVTRRILTGSPSNPFEEGRIFLFLMNRIKLNLEYQSIFLKNQKIKYLKFKMED